ncbi:hypothetical protein Poly21_14130 [Allorhodopirellula heiligendammensis]|uniref:Uncharacterized protein n=2 Tax=Allorhodopirellula heiligendammensis TaxID=2714739 RepID=A0A5C6C6X4_9BACT|nr:hypothetical protein Poly21_14130 [Allorhodopirellula heiligendammensis]
MGGLDSWVKQNPVPISGVRLYLLCGHAKNQLGRAAAMQYGGEDAPSPWNAPSSHQKWSWKRAVVVTGRLRVVGTESALYDRLGEFRVAVSGEFTPGDVIEFLRDHVRRKTPAWKRLKIIQSLICYRRYVQAAPFDDLRFTQTQLKSLARTERVKEERLRESGEVTVDEIEDVIGFIDPREPDVIQNLRRAIRGR